MDSNRFEIDQIIRMCNEYTESVLHPSNTKSQIMKSTIEKQYGKKHSTDCYSNYSDSYCQTYEQQWQTTIQNGQMNLSRIQASDESHRRHHSNSHHSNGASTKKDSHSSSVDHNIHAKVQLQLDMLDCNYEQDKREYYAQLIRESKRTTPIAELDKELKSQEMQYEELINTRQQKCPSIHDIRQRINEFHRMNETFYNSLSATQVELKTDDDDHWQQSSSSDERHLRLHSELKELEQTKACIENEIRDVQRRLFESKQDAIQSIELRDVIDKLQVDLACTRKKHQLLHHAILNVKLKATNAEKLLDMHQNEEREQELSLDDKKKKVEEYKQLLEKQQTALMNKRNTFNQTRNMNTHKIGIIRRQMDSIRICQAQLHTMNINSQIMHK